jgi:cystathionine beta-lyase
MQSISNGYIYTANEGIQKDIRAVAESLYIDHGNAFTTFSTIAAYEKGADWLDSLLIYLEKNVDWINAFVATELPNVSLFPVEGTYQVWLDFSQTGLEGSALTKLFGKAGFVAAPGSWLDSEGSQFARMNIAAPLADIENAFKQLKEVLEQPSEANQSSEFGSSTRCC